MHLLSGLLTPSLIKSASDIKCAFLAYDALRRPRSQDLVRRSREQGHILQLESELPDLANGNREAWQEYLEREMDVNPRWVWNVDLEGMLVQPCKRESYLRVFGRARNVLWTLRSGTGKVGCVRWESTIKVHFMK